MLIKFCGFTSETEAKNAVLAGADFIGLIFSKISPRAVDLQKARQIVKTVREYKAEVVGVFIDEDIKQINAIVTELDLNIVQLHGEKARLQADKLDERLQIIYVIGQRLATILQTSEYDQTNLKNKQHELIEFTTEQQQEISANLPKNLNPIHDFILFENVRPFVISQYVAKYDKNYEYQYFIAGGLNQDNVIKRINASTPFAIDVSSSIELSPGKKDLNLLQKIAKELKPERFGQFGGRYVPELLITPLKELEDFYNTIVATNEFQAEFIDLLNNYVGRPTALSEVKNFARAINSKARIFLKREDLLHTGAHKINNALGQCLLAKKMGKTRIIAETGAGQHGLATATACAKFGLECIIYMGKVDVERQAPNVAKMELLGAKVVAVSSGSATLKDAVNEALRDWAQNFANTHYCLGSALGPHPFPTMVANFHRVIGVEAKRQFIAATGKNPDMVIACVGGGSNAIGVFSAFIDDLTTKLVGVEAGGVGNKIGEHAARFQGGKPGVLHGSYTYLLQDENGQIMDTHSISAGLDYAAVGPAHANLFVTKRANYDSATDSEALAAFKLLTKTEGIIPALESSHALAYAVKIAHTLPENSNILVNLSGRGDKDLPSLIAKGNLL